jgi:hypothetical protein
MTSGCGAESLELFAPDLRGLVCVLPAFEAALCQDTMAAFVGLEGSKVESRRRTAAHQRAGRPHDQLKRLRQGSE